MEAKSINKVEIQGFLGKNAVVKTFESGRTLVSMSVATNESYKDSLGEWITNTTWHNVSYWKNKNSIKLDFLNKGEMITVLGKLNTRKYTDKEGRDRYITEIIAHKLEKVKTVGEEQLSKA